MPWEGKGGICALLGFVGSSQAKELFCDEGEEEELRLPALGLAELSPGVLVALCGCWWGQECDTHPKLMQQQPEFIDEFIDVCSLL